MQKNKPIRDSIQIIKKKWKGIGLIAIFDILFILLLVNIKAAVSGFNTWFYSWVIQPGPWVSIPSLSLIVIIEVLLLISIYAFFKQLILGTIQEIFKKKEVSFNRLFSFIKLNWLIGVPVLVLYIVISMFIMSYINQQMSMGNPVALISSFLVAAIVMGILLLYFYTMLNLAHFIFLRETSLKKVIKTAFISSFKLSSYKIYWHNFKILLVSSAVLLFFYAFMKLFVLIEISDYLRYGGIYKWGMYSIILIAGYLLLLFNRINFYEKYSLHE